jgi:hypothetical protein
MGMREVKVRFSEADLQSLDEMADGMGVSRAEVIRQRVLGGDGVGLTVNGYHRLVSDALRLTQGAVNRREVETVVAYVVRSVMGRV